LIIADYHYTYLIVTFILADDYCRFSPLLGHFRLVFDDIIATFIIADHWLQILPYYCHYFHCHYCFRFQLIAIITHWLTFITYIIAIFIIWHSFADCIGYWLFLSLFRFAIDIIAIIDTLVSCHYNITYCTLLMLPLCWMSLLLISHILIIGCFHFH